MKNTSTERKLRHGLVFGKFMPLHEGHLHLLRFARASCERLTILVCSLPSEPIPGELRYQWVKESFPDATVIHHHEIIPQDPSEHANFWQIWKESILNYCPEHDFDCLFGSEDYGWRMAEVLGIDYVPVNRLRTLVPTSGTDIRKDPLTHWQYVPSVARPSFCKRIRLVGPESSGKSTLTITLANTFKTVYADEYARRLLDEYTTHHKRQPGEVRYEDISMIARGQMATEDAMARVCNRLLFCDTDLRTTLYWSKFYFGRCPGWIEEEANARNYDLTLLLAPDIPWVADPQRPMPELEKRQAFFTTWKQQLDQRNERYVIIQGSWEEREKTALEAVQSLLPPSLMLTKTVSRFTPSEEQMAATLQNA